MRDSNFCDHFTACSEKNRQDRSVNDVARPKLLTSFGTDLIDLFEHDVGRERLHLKAARSKRQFHAMSQVSAAHCINTTHRLETGDGGFHQNAMVREAISIRVATSHNLSRIVRQVASIPSRCIVGLSVTSMKGIENASSFCGQR